MPATGSGSRELGPFLQAKGPLTWLDRYEVVMRTDQPTNDRRQHAPADVAPELYEEGRER